MLGRDALRRQRLADDLAEDVRLGEALRADLTGRPPPPRATQTAARRETMSRLRPIASASNSASCGAILAGLATMPVAGCVGMVRHVDGQLVGVGFGPRGNLRNNMCPAGGAALCVEATVSGVVIVTLSRHGSHPGDPLTSRPQSLHRRRQPGDPGEPRSPHSRKWPRCRSWAPPKTRRARCTGCAEATTAIW